MLNTESWKKKAEDFEVPRDIIIITERTFDAIKTPFAHEDAAQAAVWLLIHLLQMEKRGSMLCDLSSLPSSLRLWIPSEQPGEELIEHILCHYPAVLDDNADFISCDLLDAVPVIRVGECFLYLRRNYLLEHQFWQLFSTQFLPNMGNDHLGLSLSVSEVEEQTKEENLARALSIIHNSNFLLLTGGPGSGKTYTLGKILKSLICKARRERPKQPLKIILAAPTGRAQARMIESLHNDKSLRGLEEIPQEGQTLHSLLRYRTDTLDKRNTVQLLYADIVAVDEASMIDLNLFYHLLQALPNKTKLILIGDPNQLPSVEAGAVLADMLCRSQEKHHLLKEHIVELHGSKRSLNRDITSLSQAALKGSYVDLERFITTALPTPNQDNVAKIINTDLLSVGQIIAWLKKRYAQVSSLLIQGFALRPDEMNEGSSERKLLEKFFDVLNSLCILCARKDNHPLSVEALNYALSPKDTRGVFSHGMPIMVRKNMDEHQLTNGERGIVLKIQDQLLCCFRHTDNRKFKTIPLNILSNCIEPCYAMTIHKSQGSEFDDVIIILPEHCEMLMSRSLLYTAITRAKKSLTILTNLKILDLSLREDIGHTSCLSYLFAGENPSSAKKMPEKTPMKDKKTGQYSLF